MNSHQNRFNLKKAVVVLMFAVLAGSGCLLASRYPGEWLLARSGVFRLNNEVPGLPYHNEVVTRDVTERHVPDPSDASATTVETSAREIAVTHGVRREFVDRLRRQGAHSGSIQVSLMWRNGNDLDLHVMPPSGETIWYSHKRSACHGWLDVDMNASGPESDTPVENIVWRGNAPYGDYRVFVHHFANHGSPDPTAYKVRVVINGRMHLFEGSTKHGDHKKLVWGFNYGRNGVGPLAGPLPRRPRSQSSDPTVTTRTERIDRERIERRLTTGGPLKMGMPFWRSALVVAAWASMIASGLALLLIGAQSGYARKLIAPARTLVRSIVGFAVAGFVSGGIAQLFYGLLAQRCTNPQISRSLGWMVLGSLLGAAAGACIPNLCKARASLAGAIGGLMGGVLFELITRATPDVWGRGAGIWIVGFAIGLTVAVTVLILAAPRFSFRLTTNVVGVGRETSDHIRRG